MLSEKEKMLAGELYNSRDEELLAMYHHARKWMNLFNQASSESLKYKNYILQQLLGKIAEGVWIEAPFYCDYGKHISIGENTFINMNVIMLDSNYITIGKNGLIAPNVQIYTAYHPKKASERIRPITAIQKGMAVYKTQSKPVTIGDNIWIGGNSVIAPGVTIGDNVTIGANSLVLKDIPSNVLAYGNPCKVTKKQ